MENFLQTLMEDESVREAFLKQTTPDGAYRVAKPFLEDMSIEKFIDELRGIARVMDNVDSVELSSERLCMVTGGQSFGEVMKIFNSYF